MSFSQTKKIYIIAGEPSGDLHGRKLIEEIKQSKPNVQFYGLGGPQMKSVGVQLDYDMTQISAVGFTDVLKNYLKFRKIFYMALDRVKEIKPDLIILIDFPGFNLRFAKKIRLQFPMIYYITPQLWAWGKRRIYILKKYIKKLLVIFPFEKDFYAEHQIPASYVGHPLVDEIKGGPSKSEIIVIRQKLSLSPDIPTIGILPGSREKEVKRILPILLKSAQKMTQKESNIQFILSKTSSIQNNVYDSILKDVQGKINIHAYTDQHHNIIKASNILAVCSGTATFETALHDKPFFLVYKTSLLTYLIGRALVKIPYLGIVNILSKKPVNPELIQGNLTAEKATRIMSELLYSSEKREAQIKEFFKIREKLKRGNAAQLAANQIIKFLDS